MVLLERTDAGLYCPPGDFYVDPWRPVDRAVVTHAHSDHARWGMKRYLCARPGLEVMRLRLGPDAVIEGLDYGEAADMNGVRVSLHPAGHILGSAQVRMEYRGYVAVVTGDYKMAPDRTCETYEPVPAHLMVTESTFGLPIYRWPDPATIAHEIDFWWQCNQAEGKASLLMGYALGKAQRALALLNPDRGPIYLHGALVALTAAYRNSGIALPPTLSVAEAPRDEDWGRAMILAPPSAQGTPWLRRFGDHSAAFMSGWMQIRGAKRRRAVDRGFVLSDHVDWPSLLAAIQACGPEEVWVTHGYSAVVARHLEALGYRAQVLATAWESERDAEEEETVNDPAGD
jgi:putative mRNA 3-end processing factor